MKFCPNCNFKFYQTETNDSLLWVCRNCGTKEPCKDHILVTHYYKEEEIDDINVRDLIYDPSYPRLRKIPCPNGKCESKKDKGKQECIFLTGSNLKQIYVCTACSTQWGY